MIKKITLLSIAVSYCFSQTVQKSTIEELFPVFIDAKIGECKSFEEFNGASICPVELYDLSTKQKNVILVGGKSNIAFLDNKIYFGKNKSSKEEIKKIFEYSFNGKESIENTVNIPKCKKDFDYNKEIIKNIKKVIGDKKIKITPIKNFNCSLFRIYIEDTGDTLYSSADGNILLGMARSSIIDLKKEDVAEMDKSKIFINFKKKLNRDILKLINTTPLKDNLIKLKSKKETSKTILMILTPNYPHCRTTVQNLDVHLKDYNIEILPYPFFKGESKAAKIYDEIENGKNLSTEDKVNILKKYFSSIKIENGPSKKNMERVKEILKILKDSKLISKVPFIIMKDKVD